MKVRKEKIEKPKFLKSYVISAAIMLAVFFLIAFIFAVFLWNIYVSDAESEGIYYKSAIEEGLYELIDKEEITNEDLNKIKLGAASYYSQTTSKCKIKIDGYGEIDSSKTAAMYYSCWAENKDMDTYRSYVLLLADNKYLEYFNTPEALNYYLPCENGEEYYPKGLELEFYCTEFYADLEKGLFIPVEVEICEDSHNTSFYPTGVKFRIEPDNTEGYTLYKSTNYHTEFEDNTTYSANYAYVSGHDGTVTDEECDGFWNEIEINSKYHVEILGENPEYIPFTTACKDQIIIAAVIIIWLALAFAFIPASISYNAKKRRFEIFEYRRKMVDGMAHDLKTPMAAISAYSENLSNNIATDKKEYYAGKIEEKVSQMNKMVNDILEFSKSENSSAVITKTDVDIGSVISKIISDNEHVITERSLKVNFDNKSVVLKTDEKMFEQAVSNLINNAVLYSKEGTDIEVSLVPGVLLISNISAEKLEDIKNLKQAFSKGCLTRGSKGTGLGLAIADNNLTMLGYKLDIKSDGEKFIATVKL
ncbi:MAG: HAMP domain-containing histidine kinase [Clostridiales bacterium]|nr:HAMP domain-containing histidine kinase [Clostridiales bacterium]